MSYNPFISFLSVLIITSIHNVYSADYGISGVIRGEQSQQPIAFASVALFNVGDSALVAGTISDEEGRFVISLNASGKYYLEINAVGFEKYYVDQINLQDDHDKIDLGMINIHEQPTELEQVVVTAERSAVEYKVDRKVLNLGELGISENTPLSEALEVLPSIQTDGNGNVRLRGSGNFIVLVDGKPTMFSPNEVLQQYTAAQIERVEVITNPSARYNANNIAGIINLILKKEIGLGLSSYVNLGTSAGKMEIQPLALNTAIAYKHKKFGVTGTFNFNNPRYDLHFRSLQRREQGPDVDVFTSNFSPINRWKASLDVNYYISEKNALTLSAGKVNDDFTDEIQSVYRHLEEVDGVFSSLIHNLDDKDGVAVTVQDRHWFDENGHELKVMTAYFNERHYEHQDFSEYTNIEMPYAQRNFENRHAQDQFRLEADYTRPFDKEHALETGINVIRTLRVMNHLVKESEPVDLPLTENVFQFNSGTYAAYATWTDNFFGVDIQGGLRAEYYTHEIENADPDTLYLFNRLSFFPNLFLSKKINDRQQAQASYSRRVRRPSVSQLQPFLDWGDNTRSYSGNPALVPATINSFEASYIHTFDGVTATLETYYRQLKNDIFATGYRLNPDNGILEGSPVNIDQSSFYGVEASANIEVAAWWTVIASGTFFQNTLRGKLFESDVDRRDNGWRVRVNQAITLPNDIRFNINGFYNSSILNPQGKQEEQYWVDVTLSSSLLKKRGSVSLNVSDVLDTREFVRTNEGAGFDFLLDFDFSPLFNLSVSYKFNNYKAKENRFDFEY